MSDKTQAVTFSVTASNPTTYDIYCAVEVGNAYRLFKLPDSNDGKTFSAQLIFASQDSGVMNAFCFSHNPNDSAGKSLHVSNTVNILALSDVSGANIVSLDFVGKTTAYTSVNSETPARLYGVDSDGRYYDVSSPLAGTQWTSDEIARVNDNGCICGLKEGSTTLTATFNGLTASVNVEVSAAIEEDTQPEETPPQILTEILSNPITNQPYSYQLSASGTPPITWTHTGRLPAGLTLSESGLISGTPTKAGKSTFTAKATNDYGHDSQKFTLQVYEPVSISTASLKNATEGKNYSAAFKAKGTRQITWSAEGLPDGLSINAKTGRISGKPTVYGTYSAKITATNGAGSLTKDFALTVKGIPPRIAGNLARAELNMNYSSGLRLTAGSSPVEWSIEGALPEGLSFDAGTGIIYGIPSEAGRFRLMITASNDGGMTKPRTVTLNVKGTPPRITTAKLSDAEAGKTYSATLTATGSQPITWTAENLPDELYLDGDTIKGIPSENGRARITVYASNPVRTVKKILTLKINLADITLPEIANNDNEAENVSGHAQTSLPGHESMTGNGALSLSNDYVIVAVLSAVSCDESGMYDFSVALSDDAAIGAELVYVANSDMPSDDDSIAEFCDDTGAEISCVPESRKITVSIWLNAGTTYRPSIAVRR